MASRLPTALWRARRQMTTAGAASLSTTSHASTGAITREDHENQTLQLPDGRRLGFAEYGDPNGTPLIYFHGYPSCRLEAAPLNPIAQRQNLRILSLDRPGFGLSTPQPNRSILDWPTDVRAFAGAMGLSSFAVMGLSGGGPFAVACARSLPRNMLHGVGVFASGPPWAAGAHYMTRTRRVTAWLSEHWPFSLKMILASVLGMSRWLTKRAFVTRWLDNFIVTQDAKEEVREVIPIDTTKTVPQRREQLLKYLIEEPFRQGVDASVYEAKLLSSQDWGFQFEDVEYKPIRIWHGKEDRNAPIEMIRYMSARLPGGVLTEVANHTHYDMWKKIEAAFAELKADAQAKRQDHLAGPKE